MEIFDKLEQIAIEHSLAQEWEQAIEINKQIIQLDKINIPALNRLGKAYLAIGLTPKAEKIFKSVLKMDPNNKVAKKNMTAPTNILNTKIDTSNLIKEPGTSAYTNIKITGKSVKAKNLHIGQTLHIKIHDKISIYDELENFIGYLPIEIASKLIKNKITEHEIRISVLSKKKGVISVLVKVERPIFNTTKSDIILFIGEGEEELIEDAIDMTTTENQIDVKAREMVGGMIEEEENNDDEDIDESNHDDRESDNEEDL